MTPQYSTPQQLFLNTESSGLSSSDNNNNNNIVPPTATANNVLEDFNIINSSIIEDLQENNAFNFKNTFNYNSYNNIQQANKSSTQYFANIYSVFNGSDISTNNSSDMLSSTASNATTITPTNQYTFAKAFTNGDSLDNLLNDFSNYSEKSCDSAFEDSLQYSDTDNTISNNITTTSSPVESTIYLENNIHLSPKSSSKHLRRMSHPATHTYNNSKKNRYGCKFCGKYFSRPSSLSTHLNTHTGDKPFICPYKGCCKGFNARSNMTRHYKTHFKMSTGEYLLPSGEIVNETPSLKQLCIEEL